MRGGLGCEAAVGGTRREGAWVTVGGGRRRRVECDEVEMREVFCCRGRGRGRGAGGGGSGAVRGRDRGVFRSGGRGAGLTRAEASWGISGRGDGAVAGAWRSGD